MPSFVSLSDAIAAHVHDGDVIALEGFSHLIPFAAGHELIRQGRRDLSLVRMVPDIIGDQLIGAGCVRRLSFAWAGNPGVGSLHRFRDAVENDWPAPLELDEHSHAGMANRYVAGAAGLPFAVLRGYAGTGLMGLGTNVRVIACPFTGERLAAVSALHPDVTVVHAQQADRAGNVQLWGVVGVQKEAILSADRVIVTVEEIVEQLQPRPNSLVIPNWVISAISVVPGGCWPSYALDYSIRDDTFYVAWESISRDRDLFQEWIRDHVLADAS